MGCVLLKMRFFFVGVSMLWVSSMATTVTAGAQSEVGFFGLVGPFSNLAGYSSSNSRNTLSLARLSTPVQSPSPSPSSCPPLPHRGASHPRLDRHRNQPYPQHPPKIAANKGSDKGLNHGQLTGLVLLSIAGLLQVVVLTYLLVKRRQMLRVVERYEV